MADEKQQSAEQMSETLVNAMDIIAKSAVQGLQFDKTEIAEIVDITGRENGDYVVFNGSARYHAYTENTSYTLGTKVYVNIPNNDMSGEKTIIRRYNLKDSDRGLNYISPWDRFTPSIEGNILKHEQILQDSGIWINDEYTDDNGIGLLANFDKTFIETEDNPRNFPEAQTIKLYEIHNLSQFEFVQGMEYLGLSADFRSLLSGENTVSGNYGLKITCSFVRDIEGKSDDTIVEKHTYVLDTQNMIGSIYNFFTYFEQQAVFKLPDLEMNWTLEDMIVEFFQEGNFRNAAGYVPIAPLDNIYVKNINITFGYDKKDTYDIDDIRIYTIGPVSYDTAQKSTALNERRVYLRWLHRNPKSADDDNPYGKMEEIKRINNIPNETDLTFKANIWWLRTSAHTLDEYRAEQDSKNTSAVQRIELQTEYLEDLYTLDSNELNTKWYTGDLNSNARRLIDAFGLKKSNNGSTNGDYAFSAGIYQIFDSGAQKIQQPITQNDYNAGTLERSSEWGEGWIPVQEDFNTEDFYIDFVPDLKEKTTNIQCVIEYGPWIEEKDENGDIILSYINKESEYYTVLKSNLLEFKNLSWIPDPATWDALIGLNITFNDRSNGYYPLYNGSDGYLLNPNDASKDRTLEADIQSSYSGKSYLNGQEELIWKIPITNTMISVAETAQLTMGGSFLQSDDKIFEKYSSIISYDENYKYLWYAAGDATEGHNSGFQRYVYDYQIKLNEYRDNLFNKAKAYLKSLETYANLNDNQINDLIGYHKIGDTELFIESCFIEGKIDVAIRPVTIKFFDETEIDLTSVDDVILSGFQSILNQIERIKQKILEAPKIYTVYNRLNYRIGQVYTKDKVNNTITCYLIKNGTMIKTDVEMTFTQHGTAGTDYTFALYFGKLYNENWQEVGPQEPFITVGEKNYREILFDLYDVNNERIELTSEQKNAIISLWVRNNTEAGDDSEGFWWGNRLSFNNNFESLLAMENDNKVRFAIKTRNGITIEQCKGYVLKASHASDYTVSTYNDKQYPLYGINFIQLLPITVRADDKYEMTVSNYIYYSDFGAQPRYYNSALELRYNGEIASNSLLLRKAFSSSQTGFFWGNDQSTPAFGVLPEVKKNNSTKNDNNGLPALYKNDSEYVLIPYPMYFDGIINTPCVLEAWIKNEENNNILVYATPIIILQNEYQVPALNSWDGNLLVDYENNRLMAAMVAAGHKDVNNRFSGVIMGDIGTIDNNEQSQVNTVTGLYGYHQGTQSFGFLENGTGFIGKSGTGRIYFDGEHGTIQSGNYNSSGGTDGTKIDLDDGSIDMWGRGRTWNYNQEEGKYIPTSLVDNARTHIHLDTVGSKTKPYFSIKVPRRVPQLDESDSIKRNADGEIIYSEQADMHSLIEINEDQYYLQTADYDDNKKLGLQINLKNGTFNSFNKLKIHGGLGSEIYFGDDHKNFTKIGINNNGKSYLEMEGGNGSEAQVESTATSMVRYADDLNYFLWSSQIQNNAWTPTNNSASVFDNPTFVEKYTETGNVLTVFPKATTSTTYFNTILDNITNKTSNLTYLGKDYSEFSVEQLFEEGCEIHEYSILKSNPVLPNNHICYQKIETLLTDEGDIEIPQIKFKRIENNNEIENYFIDNPSEDSWTVYYKGYQEWKEMIPPYIENFGVTYDTGEKCYDTNQQNVWESIIDKNRKSLNDLTAWKLSTQNLLLDERYWENFDLYIEAMQRMSSNEYKTAETAYINSQKNYEDAFAAFKKAENANNIAETAYTNALQKQINARNAIANNLTRYNYIIKTTTNIGSTQGNQPIANIADDEFLVEYNKTINKAEDAKISKINDWSYLELLKAKKAAETVLTAKESAVTTAKNIFETGESSWNNNNSSRELKGYVQIKQVNATSENYLLAYNAYADLLYERDTLLNELEEIKRHFLKKNINGVALINNEKEIWDPNEDISLEDEQIAVIEPNLKEYQYWALRDYFNQYTWTTKAEDETFYEKFMKKQFTHMTDNNVLVYGDYKSIITGGYRYVPEGDEQESLYTKITAIDTNITTLQNDLTEKETILQGTLLTDFETWWPERIYDFITTEQYTGELFDEWRDMAMIRYEYYNMDFQTALGQYLEIANNMNTILINEGKHNFDLYSWREALNSASFDWNDYSQELSNTYWDALGDLEHELTKFDNAYKNDYGIDAQIQFLFESYSLQFLNYIYDHIDDNYTNLIAEYDNITDEGLFNKINTYWEYYSTFWTIKQIQQELVNEKNNKRNITNNNDLYTWVWNKDEDTQYIFSAPQNVLIQDYNKLRRWIVTLPNEYNALNNRKISLLYTKDKKTVEKEILVKDFEENFTETYKNYSYSHTFNLYTKYNNWQDAITERDECQQLINSISQYIKTLEDEKARLETTIFIELGKNAKNRWNQLNEEQRNAYLYKEQVNSDFQFSYRIAVTNNETYSSKKTYYEKKHDFSEFNEEIQEAEENYQSAADALRDATTNYDSAYQAYLKAKQVLDNFGVNYFPLIMPQDYENDNSFDKTATYYKLVDGQFQKINSNDLATYISHIIFKYVDVASIKNILLQVINNNIKNIQTSTVKDRYYKKLTNYSQALEKFVYYNQPDVVDNVIKLNNTQKIRLQIGQHFTVNNEGYMKASAGEMKNITVESLNFNGYTDNTGTHPGATGIVPKWMTFLTDAWLTGTKENLEVSAEIYKEVSVDVPFDRTYEYPTVDYQNVTVSGSFSCAYPGQYGAPSIYGTGLSTNLSATPFSSEGGGVGLVRYTGSYSASGLAKINGTGIGYIHDTKSVPYVFKDTWTAWSTVPAITSIVLHRKYISMWTLTNDSATEGESSDYNLR